MNILIGILIGIVAYFVVMHLINPDDPFVAEGWEDETGFHYGEHPK